MAENNDIANKLSLGVYNIYRVVSQKNGKLDANAFGKDVTLENVQGKIDKIVKDDPYLAEAALIQIQKELVFLGKGEVDLTEKGFNIYSLPNSVRYAIWKAFKDSEIYSKIGYEGIKTKKFIQYKLYNPNLVDTIGGLPRLWDPIKNVSINSNLSIEYTPTGTTFGNHGWIGNLLKTEGINSIKIKDLGVSAKVWKGIYVAFTGDLENTNFFNTGSDSNERDPACLGSDLIYDVKAELVCLNPVTFTFFKDRSRYMSITQTKSWNTNNRSDAVTPFNPGKIENNGYRTNVYFDVANGAGGAVGCGLDYYNSRGEEQNLPGDSGWFEYKRYGAGYSINYQGTLGSLDLGINLSDEVGNRDQETVTDGSLAESDWNRYRESQRSATISIGIPSWIYEPINAHPVISFNVRTSTLKDRELSDIYTVGLKLGKFEISGSSAVNFIPRDRDDASGEEPINTYFWNVKVPLDAAYWASRKNGEPDPKISAGAVLNLGGYFHDHLITDGQPIFPKIYSPMGLYFNVKIFFGPGTGHDKDEEALRMTQGTSSQMTNNTNPNIKKLKIENDAREDFDQLGRMNLAKNWTNRKVQSQTTERSRAKNKKATTEGTGKPANESKEEKKPVLPETTEKPKIGDMSPATTGQLKIGDLTPKTTGQAPVSNKKETPVKNKAKTPVKNKGNK